MHELLKGTAHITSLKQQKLITGDLIKYKVNLGPVTYVTHINTIFVFAQQIYNIVTLHHYSDFPTELKVETYGILFLPHILYNVNLNKLSLLR